MLLFNHIKSKNILGCQTLGCLQQTVSNAYAQKILMSIFSSTRSFFPSYVRTSAILIQMAI